ncbi:EAL and HDOD domain-containing protein [Vibrio sp. HB161653]
MPYSYIARQPILDVDLNTQGYELLFRDGPKNTFPDIDPELATSRLLSDHLLVNINETLNGKFGFVNFPYESLINGIPSLFPKEALIVEILEDCPPTDELLVAVKELAQQGYQLALDDFIPHQTWGRFLPYISIIKFDIRAVTIEKAAKFIRSVHSVYPKMTFLAEKVETYDEFKQARAAGFVLFQGYFFSKPEMIQNKHVNPSLLTTIKLCQEIAQSPMDLKAVEQIVASDVTLSFKLLSYVNTRFYLQKSIKSFSQALAYLGEEKIRQFSSLVSLACIEGSKPNALYQLAVARAQRCHDIVKQLDSHYTHGEAFLVGMFSLLDSLLDQPLESILSQTPLDQEIITALLKGEGLLAQVLQLVIAYENAHWSAFHQYQHELNLDSDTLHQLLHQPLDETAV